MKNLRFWVKLPSEWIEGHGLKEFRWDPGKGASNISALILLMVIAQHAGLEDGAARLTYTELCELSGLSRAKVSAGLSILEGFHLVSRRSRGRSTFQLTNYNPEKGWAKLPARLMYKHGMLSAFSDFTLRRSAELNALKLYFLLVARRDRKTNRAALSYEKIEEYSGISKAHIKGAVSQLAGVGLIYVHTVPSVANNGHGISFVYGLAYLQKPTDANGEGLQLKPTYPAVSNDSPF